MSLRAPLLGILLSRRFGAKNHARDLHRRRLSGAFLPEAFLRLGADFVEKVEVRTWSRFLIESHS